MKEKIGFLIVSVLMSAFITVGVVAFCHQNNWLPSPEMNNFDEGDSVKVAQVYEQLKSPVMYTIKDVQDLQDQMVHESTVDNLFMSITPDIMRNVANVLLNTEGCVTKESIVKEYRANDGIYNNLPAPETTTETADSSKVDLSATDLGNRPDKTISSSFKRRTDTVGGKPVTVVTETREHYE
jgi:hypothetical protein